ncbi:TniQ family protein [Aquitalea sp. LB_tupeE]|uniref:TniQ family protein n=1 Tax=Aquitalea sp. LB_tupeE TaxID=2748078 RepID=UPI0015BE853D|nr:TniQ family protein [Aquitalea sp. LB_tupeE]NWK76913.1 TniQ family protein [Aquitalea sp. LB_tupeE]
MIPLLPVRPLPKPSESTIGYLLRLGAANDFQSLPRLQNYRKHIGMPAQSFEEFVKLATGHGPDLQQNLWGPSSSDLPIQPNKKLGIKSTYWSLDHRRWCPDCLREGGYWKAEWLITLQVACPNHQRLLHEQCPSCNQPVGWYSGGLTHCRCGQVLTVGPLSAVSDSVIQIAQMISIKLAEATSSDTNFKPPHPVEVGLAQLLADVRLPRFLDLLWALGCNGRYGELKKSLKVPDHHRIAIAFPVLDCAAQMLTHWPRSFHSFMLGLCDQSQAHALHMYRFVGAQLLALNRTLTHPELHFVRHEFERFVSEHWKGVIADRHRFADDIAAEHPTILAKEAMEKLGITRKKLITLVNQGHIQGWYQQSKGELRFLVIDRQSVLRFKQNSEGKLFTLAQAAEYLATTIPRVRLFVKGGLLTAVYQPEGGNERRLRWVFEKSDLDKLLGGLNIQVHATPDCDSVISLEKICRSRSSHGADLVTLLNAIRAGELDCIARDPCYPGIRGLMLDMKQFETWFTARWQSQPFFTMQLAARYLGLKGYTLHWLRDHGFLHDLLPPERTRGLSLPKTTLDRFKSRYLWGHALEEMTGYGRSNVARALINRGLIPVTGPMVDGGTTYLFLRQDVQDFLKRHGSAETWPCKTIGGGGGAC